MAFEGVRGNLGAAAGGVRAGVQATGDVLSGSGASGSGLISSMGKKALWVAEASANVATKPLKWAGEFMQNNPRGAKLVAGVGLVYAAKKGYDYVAHLHDVPSATEPVLQMDQMIEANGQVVSTMQQAQEVNAANRQYAITAADYQGKGVASQQMALAGGYSR